MIETARQPTVVHLVHSLYGGGTERMLVQLLHRFDPRSTRHVVVTLRSAGDLAAELPEHVACRPLDVDGKPRWTGLRLAGLLRKLGPTILHARNSGTWADAILAGVLTSSTRIVLAHHGLENAGSFNLRQRLKIKAGLAVGAEFSAVSKSCKTQLVHAGVPEDRITLLTNGVNTSRFCKPIDAERQSARRDLGLDPALFVIVAVGSLTPVKRLDVFLRAISLASPRIDNLRAILVGDGPERQALSSLAEVLRIADRVRFVGFQHDIRPYLTGASLFVNSSDSEGMSNSLLEAMACGLPIIATDVGDHSELLQQGRCGLVIPPGSPEALAAALTELASSASLRATIASNALDRASSLGLESVAKNYEHFYRSLHSQNAISTSVNPVFVR